MAVLDLLTELSGKWRGRNQLWLSPEAPGQESETDVEIRTIAQGQFSEIRYGWAFEDQPQEGRLILGLADGQESVKAVWFDTWHMRGQFMVCEGNAEEDGSVSVQGTYPAPPGPDWGWQITIQPGDGETFRLLMHNITPNGEKMLAVEAIYSRLV
jgi:hypothetical protein